jgi:hypothetical protein
MYIHVYTYVHMNIFAFDVIKSKSNKVGKLVRGELNLKRLQYLMNKIVILISGYPHDSFTSEAYRASLCVYDYDKAKHIEILFLCL